MRMPDITKYFTTDLRRMMKKFDPLDLNGDGKNDAADDAMRLWMLQQATGGQNRNSGSSSCGCGTGFIILLLILIPIMIVGGAQSCSSNRGNSYKSTYNTSGRSGTNTTKTLGNSSSSAKAEQVMLRTDLEAEEYISGTFPATGYYATQTAFSTWTYDKQRAGDKKQYFKYSYGESYPKYGFVRIYIIWLDENGYIVHVNGSGNNKITNVSEARSTPIYDVTAYSTAEQFYKKYENEFHGFSEAEQYYNLHSWIKPYVEKYGKPDIISSSAKAITAKPTPETTTVPTKKPTVKPEQEDDPYDAKDYAHPDDFYYDYYDDFWDYEDAEDYWEEHQ